MESGNFKDIIMQYLTLRWFTLSHFNENKLRIFHSLEKALKNANTKDLYWYVQTENYLKKEFRKIKMDNTHLIKLKKFDENLKNFLIKHKIDSNLFFKNLDFMQKCDCLIYHHAHAINNTSTMITSLP